MINIIKIIFQICLLRKGPEDLPADGSMLLKLLILSFVVSIFLGRMIYDMRVAVISSMGGLLFSLIFTKILLSKKPERFIQTFSAMLGTVTLMNIISLPVFAPLSNEQLNENVALLFSLVSFAFLIWVIVIYGFIFSRALSTTLNYGIAISVGYAFLSIMILQLVLTAKVPI